MKVYVAVETADVEIIGVETFTTKDAAMEYFNACVNENKPSPSSPSACRLSWAICTRDELKDKIAGTIAMAGDDSYSVQVVERDGLSFHARIITESMKQKNR